jgi:DNA invertase Pin-like site-specific DNA recombinase
MAHLGYARVSTTHQTLEQQHDALRAAGVERIFDDRLSGAIDDRPGLAELLNYAREGDAITVVALDRLGRSVMHILRTMQDLHQRGIVFKSLREGVDFSTPVGQMVAGIFMHLAQYERTLIAERAEAAGQAARARGRHVGRPKTIEAAKVEQARILRAAGQTMPQICTALGVSRATLYRALNLGTAA